MIPTAAPEMPQQQHFIPPQAERMPQRAPRMPRIDELPIPGQNQLRAHRAGQVEADHVEKGRMSLLQRLASVGLGRRDEQRADVPPEARQAPRQQPQRPTQRMHESRGPDPVSEYAKRSAPQGLDPMGRQTAVHNPQEEDQLDIPAFLRRQAN
jgi:cell division protein FtsZ